MNLQTREERVRLLKMGINGKQIEQLYIKYNGLIVTDVSILNESWQIKNY